MAIFGDKTLMEINTKIFVKGKPISLEELIRRDFGEQGVEEFKKYNVLLSVPINESYVLKLSFEGVIYEGFTSKILGKEFVVENQDVQGIRVRGEKKPSVDFSTTDKYELRHYFQLGDDERLKDDKEETGDNQFLIITYRYEKIILN